VVAGVHSKYDDYARAFEMDVAHTVIQDLMDENSKEKTEELDNTMEMRRRNE
jgi:hypothetical protein